MKRKKYNQSGVWACPVCYTAATKEAVNNFKMACERNKIPLGNPERFHHCGEYRKPLYFDSQAEYVVARFLKEKENRGLLAELKHHPRIEVIPAIYYNVITDDFIALPNLKDRDTSFYRLIYKPEMYEADFSFVKDGETHYVEVKSVDRYNQPFIPNVSKFRQKLERIKAIHGIEVEVWTGNIRWHFVGKKLEVIK